MLVSDQVSRCARQRGRRGDRHRLRRHAQELYVDRPRSGVEVFAEGGITALDQVRVWQLGFIWR